MSGYYACERCNEQFITPESLKKHLNTNLRKMPCDQLCDKCGCTLSTRSAYRYHRETECFPKIRFDKNEKKEEEQEILTVKKDKRTRAEEAASLKISKAKKYLFDLLRSEYSAEHKNVLIDLLSMFTDDNDNIPIKEKPQKHIDEDIQSNNIAESNVSMFQSDENDDVKNADGEQQVVTNAEKLKLLGTPSANIVSQKSVHTPLTNANEHVYLLWKREFKRLNEPTYKIGRTGDTISIRMNGYDKDSELLLNLPVKNSLLIEKKIKELFILKYKQMKQYGTEYFYGDFKEMQNDMLKIVELYNIDTKNK